MFSGKPIKSFEAFVEGLCTPDCLQRVHEKYGIDKDTYVQNVWKDMVAGHHHLALQHELKLPPQERTNNFEMELESVLAFGEKMGYDLNYSAWWQAWRRDDWRESSSKKKTDNSLSSGAAAV